MSCIPGPLSSFWSNLMEISTALSCQRSVTCERSRPQTRTPTLQRCARGSPATSRNARSRARAAGRRRPSTHTTGAYGARPGAEGYDRGRLLCVFGLMRRSIDKTAGTTTWRLRSTSSGCWTGDLDAFDGYRSSSPPCCDAVSAVSQDGHPARGAARRAASHRVRRGGRRPRRRRPRRRRRRRRRATTATATATLTTTTTLRITRRRRGCRALSRGRASRASACSFLDTV